MLDLKCFIDSLRWKLDRQTTSTLGGFQRVPPVVNGFYYIEKDGCKLGGFQASLLKLLPELLLPILMRVLSDSGIPENFGLP